MDIFWSKAIVMFFLPLVLHIIAMILSVLNHQNYSCKVIEIPPRYFAILLGDAALVGTRTGRVKKTLASV